MNKKKISGKLATTVATQEAREPEKHAKARSRKVTQIYAAHCAHTRFLVNRMQLGGANVRTHQSIKLLRMSAA